MSPNRRGPAVEPLVWNVAGLLDDELGATRDYVVAGATIDLGDDLRLADPIEGSVRLARTNRGLLVIAELGTSLAAQCSRCLREIEGPIHVSIDEEALPSLDLHSGQPVAPSGAGRQPLPLPRPRPIDPAPARPARL